MKRYLSFLLGLSWLFTGLNAQAARLDFLTSSANVSLGATFTVDVYMALDQGTPSSGYLAAYDLDLNFNASRLQLNSVSFDTALGDALLGESLQASDNSQTGLVNISELSLLEESAGNCVFCSAPYLADLQQAPLFKLASMSFTALDLGSADFAVTLNAIVDGSGDALPTSVGSFPGGMQITAVPLPSAAWLFLSGLPLLARLKRRA